MKKEDYIGYIGLALVQFNVLPSIVQALKTGVNIPVASVVLMIAGLSCYLYNSVKTGNTLYTVGNTIGLVANIILLGAILR